MSIRKKPEEAVPVLLARLEKAKQYALTGNADADVSSKFKEIEELLHGMKDLYPKIKRWEKTVLQQLCVLEQELDDDVFKDPEKEIEINEKLELVKDDIEKLNGMVNMVDMGVSERSRTMTLPRYQEKEDNDDHQIFSQEWSNLGIEDKIFGTEAMSSLFASFHCLESSQVKLCLLCLSIFPENSVIKKKPIVYWWIGEGLVTKTKDKTAEEVGEDVFRELLNEGFIKSNKNSRVSVNSFIVYPWIRRMLIVAARENGFLTFCPKWTPCNGSRRAFLWQGNDSPYALNNGETEEDLLLVFNVNEQYLGIRAEWLAKLKKVEVLQMGRWQSCETHHIELEDQELLNGVGSQKHLQYLSLRGISRIETLPSSFLKLISLKILDLRACHNLEKLPQGISALTNLTHLDVSECYLLESMPKGLDHLLALQVLKGFVIGKAGKNSCKISDLIRLKNLRKLSVRIGDEYEAHQEGQLFSLMNLSALRILAISWGVISMSPESKEWFTSLPPNLKKLKLCCIPLTEVPCWLRPSTCPADLEKLYIKGGKLNSLGHTDTKKWLVKFLRLKYLKNLRIDQEQMVLLFPEYMYLEKISCHKLDPDIILDRAGYGKQISLG